MKKFILILALVFFCSNYVYADAQETITKTTKNVIKFGKNFLKGLNDGVDEGRKEATGVDGAVTVTNVEELEKYVTVEILSILSEKKDSETHVTVGFKNRADKPVRIANLDDKGIILLIDSDGYSQALSNRSRRSAELTIPSGTGMKHTFIFDINIKKADKIRLWNKEFPLQKEISK